MSAPRVVLLTGRSDPARTGLPEAQAAFLAAVTPPGAEALRDGYPWTGGAPERAVPLPLAAWRNLRAWRHAHTPRGARTVAARVADIAARRTAIVTGSCGLDMLAGGWERGACELVVALGPVTRTRPALPGARLTTIVGRRDLISRALHRAPPDICVPCGHMAYWTCPETRAVVAAVLAGWAQ